MTIYTVSVEHDSNGDMILPFPDEMIDELNWEVGDILVWSQNDDGSVSITKAIRDGSVVVTGADSDIE